MMMPFIDYAPEVSFEKPIDSIAVSGHKMLGCPMPCGIALTRKEHVAKVEMKVRSCHFNDKRSFYSILTSAFA